MVQRPDAILIAGPTASGKSKYALEQAESWDCEIINTDSMQVYPVLDILTARPDAEDLQRIVHHLYGFAPLDEAYSVARWVEDATQVTQDVWARNKVPIFVGGTGLYFKGLDIGLAKIPDVPDEIRREIRSKLVDEGSGTLHAELQTLDAVGAAQLRSSDGQRIARALEVIRATGKPLRDFQNEPMDPTVITGKNVLRTVLMPDRVLLHDRINKRTEWMVDNGAEEEVRQLLALDLPPESTVLKAIGVEQFQNYILGKYSLNEATERIKAATRQYAKRQSTWFRGQFGNNWQFLKSYPAT